VLVAPDDSRALHWKNPRVKERMKTKKGSSPLRAFHGILLLKLVELMKTYIGEIREEDRREMAINGALLAEWKLRLMRMSRKVSRENLEEGGNDDFDNYASPSPYLDDDVSVMKKMMMISRCLDGGGIIQRL